MLPMAGNFPNDKRFQGADALCYGCGVSKENQSHVTECSGYKDIREQFMDLSGEDNLVKFHMAMMVRRDEGRNR